MFNLFYLELYVGQKDICDQLIDQLKSKDIPYKLKSNNRRRMGLFIPFNSTYSALGMRQNQYRNENAKNKNFYYLYVKRKDLEKAKAVINTARI